MKGIVLNTVLLAGKAYTFNDIEGITGCPFQADKFYGGRIGRFGKTSAGVYLCLEPTGETVVDIFVDIDNLQESTKLVLVAIADIVKAKKAAYSTGIKLPDSKQVSKMKKDALIGFILENAVEIFSTSGQVQYEATEADTKIEFTNIDPDEDSTDDEDDDGFALPGGDVEEDFDEDEEEDE